MRIDDLEEDLEAERSFRMKAEQSKIEASKELQELQDRLEEAGGINAAQIELNKKRDAELTKCKREAEEASIQREAAMAAMRKRQSEIVADLEQQIEAANYSRAK